MPSKLQMMKIVSVVVCSGLCFLAWSCKTQDGPPEPSGVETPAEPGDTPGEEQPGEAQPGEQPAEAQPGEAPPGEQPGEAQPGEEQPGSETPEEGAESSAPMEGTSTPAETTESSAGPPDKPAGAVGIQPGTKRTAAGLPDPLTAYQSWYRLGACASPPEGSGAAHLPARQAYILLPDGHATGIGVEVKTPLPPETIIVLEAMSSTSDFIESVDVMTRGADSWKLLRYTRGASDAAFAPADGGTDSCASCHSKATDTDSVYSGLKLE